MNTEVNKYNLRDLKEHDFGESIDLFISSISFEERCTSVALNLESSKIQNHLCFMNKPSDIDAELKNKFKNMIETHFVSKHELKYLEKQNPIENASIINASIKKFLSTKPLRLLIDSTTFNHETLLILLKILLNNLDAYEQITFLYNPAKEYAPTIVEIENKWLSKGVKEIRTVLGYPGKFDSLKKFHLIILAGMEYERTSRLIEVFEPSQLSIGFPMEKSPALKTFESNRIKYQKMLSVYSKDTVHFFQFSAYSPTLTKEMLKEHISSFENYNNVITPLNNKISTLGVGLLCHSHDEIQICYPIPNMYNMDYSSVSDEFYVFDLKK